jgi:integrase
MTDKKVWFIELLPQNPASGKRRRLKSTRPNRLWVEPQQLPALLDGAERAGSGVGRMLLGLLAGSGLRIGEALDLRWRHVDLATGTLHVGKAKTVAGVRSVDLTAALREELVLWRATSPFTAADDYVITTTTGRKHNPSNLRRDILRTAMEAANKELAKDGIAEIEGVTFHSLRRTFATLRSVCGDDVRYIASQIGHTDVRFTLSVYAQATKRRERLSGPHLRAYDRAIEWAQMGTNGTADSVAVPREATKSPA